MRKIFHLSRLVRKQALIHGSNFGEAVLKVFLIDLGYFFSEKYIETRELNEKYYILGLYSEQTKAMNWRILLFLCSIVLSSIIL